MQEETLSWAGRLEEEHHERSRDWDLFLVRCTYGMGEYGKHMETYTVPYTCISYVYVYIYIIHIRIYTQYIYIFIYLQYLFLFIHSFFSFVHMPPSLSLSLGTV